MESLRSFLRRHFVGVLAVFSIFFYKRTYLDSRPYCAHPTFIPLKETQCLVCYKNGLYFSREEVRSWQNFHNFSLVKANLQQTTNEQSQAPVQFSSSVRLRNTYGQGLTAIYNIHSRKRLVFLC